MNKIPVQLLNLLFGGVVGGKGGVVGEVVWWGERGMG